MNPPPNRTKVGRYEIVHELGRGGMGVVWLANDPELHRQVAIKSILPPAEGGAEEGRQLFERLIREARAGAALDHPNIVKVIDIMRDGNTAYLILEYVRGNDLKKLMSGGVPLDREYSLRILEQCAHALDHAHQRDVVHRDIKPANIMIEESGRARIMDFGIAKRLDGETGLTGGMAIGTLEFMAPEQLGGRRVDGRTDQYSLAVVAYRMLTGRPIFDSTTMEAWCFAVSTENPVPATSRNGALPGPVDRVLEKALAKAAEQRYGSCAAFVAALRIALTPPVIPVVDHVAAERDRAVREAVAAQSAAELEALRSAREQASAPPEARINEPSVKKPPRKSLPWKPITRLLLVLGAVGGAGYVATRDKPPHPVVREEKRPEPLKQGDVKTNPKDGLKYVYIPPGQFTMGCSAGDDECDADEKPTHPVEITKGFWLGQTEVTQNAYLHVTGKDPSHFKGSQLPVEQVDWNEARDYCKAIGGRLPAEAEWEYAARAGSTSARYGDVNIIAWHEGNSGKKTHPVGEKVPNAFGLYDMLGNVWEWNADWYGPYQGATQNNPVGASTGTFRGVRGGSWNVSPRGSRSSYRFRLRPDDRYNYLGLRCAGE